MDQRAALDQHVEGLVWGELFPPLEYNIANMWDDVVNSPPPTSTPHLPSTSLAGFELNAPCQPAASQDGKFENFTLTEDSLQFFDLQSPAANPDSELKIMSAEDIMESCKEAFELIPSYKPEYSPPHNLTPPPSSTFLAGFQSYAPPQPAQSQDDQLEEFTTLEDALKFYDQQSPVYSPFLEEILWQDNNKFNLEQYLPSYSYLNDLGTAEPELAPAPVWAPAPAPVWAPAPASVWAPAPVWVPAPSPAAAWAPAPAPAPAWVPAPVWLPAPAPATMHPPAVYPQPYQGAPISLPVALKQNPPPDDVHDGHALYQALLADYPYMASFAAPPPCTSSSKKRKRKEKQHDDRPHIMKTPNDIMIFMSMQRMNVPDAVKETGKEAVVAHLGQMWNSLAEEQSASYKAMAEALRVYLTKLSNEQSTSDNKGQKKKKRMTRRKK
ncbi:extensin-like isoform X1 [Notolabrus celidotus]|uniref:extensin-like isoform X1 n=1 Tax=Notolabrus celidotus TaxID=1203425 RepID=UPI00148F8E27|nr:extensin-like isoform X1 [Notolabrus celidotus]